MKVYAYGRISKGVQFIGIETQRAICAAYAKSKGHQIERFFKDENVGWSVPFNKRHGLKAAISALSQGDILLVVRRDRLGRGAQLIEKIEEEIASRGARILSTWGEGTESDDSYSLSLRKQADSFAEYEHHLISRRTSDALQVKKNRGERIGHIPYGFTLSADAIHIEKDPTEQDTLKQIRKLHRQGLSVRKMAAELNRQRKFNRNYTKWNHSSLHRIMQKGNIIRAKTKSDRSDVGHYRIPKAEVERIMKGES